MRALLRRTREYPVWDVLAFAGIVMAVLAVIRLLPGPDPVEVSGAARVVDGDSLIVRNVEIRLKGVDAPERGQSCERGGARWPCGERAAVGLARHLGARRITCRGNEHDVHGRLLALCRLRDGEINRWLVERGWAVSYDAYPAAERDARRARRGIWSGTFVQPRDWREENR